MQKVYADSLLGYSQDEHFDIPKGFVPCENSLGEDDFGEGEPVEEIFE